MGIIGESATGSFVVHDPRQHDAAANDGMLRSLTSPSSLCGCAMCGHNKMFAPERKTLATHLVGVMYALNK